MLWQANAVPLHGFVCDVSRLCPAEVCSRDEGCVRMQVFKQAQCSPSLSGQEATGTEGGPVM